jgi:protein-disulfide isomerase
MTRRAYAGVVGAAALLGAALIAASLIGARAGESAPGTEISGSTTSALLSGIPQSGPVLGRPDAPVTLVEFADVQCPYCAYWSHTAFAEIVRDYVRPGKVRLVFSGLAFIGPDSERGLPFALAAGHQGKLWHGVHLLYANQGSENSGWVGHALLRNVAATIPGLDVERALRESSSPAVDRQMAAAQEAAARLGIRGTPAFAAGRTGATLQPVPISNLDAGALRPALDSLLAG